MTKKNSDDDLIGFRDFLDSESEKTTAKMPTKRYNDFELMTFLEQDSIRITKHIETFEEKVYMIKNYPQDVKLTTDLEMDVASKKGEVLSYLNRNDSPLTINLSDLFNSFFNSYWNFSRSTKRISRRWWRHNYGAFISYVFWL